MAYLIGSVRLCDSDDMECRISFFGAQCLQRIAMDVVFLGMLHRLLHMRVVWRQRSQCLLWKVYEQSANADILVEMEDGSELLTRIECLT